MVILLFLSTYPMDCVCSYKLFDFELFITDDRCLIVFKNPIGFSHILYKVCILYFDRIMFKVAFWWETFIFSRSFVPGDVL